jgi:hypothetical protein
MERGKNRQRQAGGDPDEREDIHCMIIRESEPGST